MRRKESGAVPEGNGPVPQQDESESDQPTMAHVYRTVKEVFEEAWDRKTHKLTENLKSMNQRVGRLQQDARQPRLAMEADGQVDNTTRERTERAATAVEAMHGDSCSANRAGPGPKTTSISFGVKAKPPALPCTDDVLVENGAAAPKSCLLPLEMRAATAAGGLLPTSKTSIATRTTSISYLFGSNEETNSKKTSTQYASYDSSFWRNYLLAVPSCRRVIETKSRQNRMFGPGSSRGRLRACPFLGT